MDLYSLQFAAEDHTSNIGNTLVLFESIFVEYTVISFFEQNGKYMSDIYCLYVRMSNKLPESRLSRVQISVTSDEICSLQRKTKCGSNFWDTLYMA